VGIVSAYAGLLLSWYLDLAAGASIVLVAIAIFFAVLIIQGAVPSRRPHPEHA
jgi:ABC-type Mn2+/Zn2+ transport system permease subunit